MDSQACFYVRYNGRGFLGAWKRIDTDRYVGADSAGGTKGAAKKSEAREVASSTTKRAGTDALARMCSGDGQ